MPVLPMASAACLVADESGSTQMEHVLLAALVMVVVGLLLLAIRT